MQKVNKTEDDKVEVTISQGQIFVSEKSFEKMRQDPKIKELLLELNKSHNSVTTNA